MEIGDRVFCYKDYIRRESKWVTKGKTYTIFEIQPDYLSIIDNQGSENEFSLDRNFHNDDINYRNFHDHFYTLKEYRKLKLLKINIDESR